MSDWKAGKKVVLGVTGGIAAYKAPEIVRALVKAGCQVEVVLTADGERFVSPMVLSTLAGKKVWRQEDFLSDERGWEIPHISLADWADAILVAPCTAQTLSNMAMGAGKELLSCLLLAARAPVVVFPAMNVHMLNHPATMANMSTLSGRGIIVADPETGALACGYEGKGRLPSVEVIMDELWRALCPHKNLLNKKILVTAGPTWEFLDPVRFLSNPSSGKMGYAMARAAWYRGGEVYFVHGPVPFPNLAGFTPIPVTSAEDMKEAVLSRSEAMDFIIKAAAVGDFKAPLKQGRKIKREGGDSVSFELVQNPDIVATLGKKKRAGQLLVGFAAESHDLLANAGDKMARKNLDFIVANDITSPGSGFGGDTNSVTILGRDGSSVEFSGTKEQVAERTWSLVLGEGPSN